MKLNIKLATFVALMLLTAQIARAENAEERIIKQQIKSAGFVPSGDLYRNPDEKLADVGKVIFESKRLSLNGNISCQTCHLDRFGSTDGIPIAAAVGGEGDGLLPRRQLNACAYRWCSRLVLLPLQRAGLSWGQLDR